MQFEFDKYPIQPVLEILLKDRTTGKNIIWATDSYIDLGKQYSDRYEIVKSSITGRNAILIQPRAYKALEDQQARTKKKAEVFTPSWIVKRMNDTLDDEQKPPKEYIRRRVIEISCGEAPFIVSRYDAASGDLIPLNERIGVLDRKMRVVNEIAKDDKDWVKQTKAAYKSVYGYEYQGDNLLIARINLLLSFRDYYQSRMGRQPDLKLLKEIAKVISYNFFQMDGLTGAVPLGKPQEINEQLSLFNDIAEEEKAPLAKIMDWGASNEMKGFIAMGKKFDVIIGNPPYQEEKTDNGRQPPIYHRFYDEAVKLADKIELITPGRFLFNAGQTPKDWNYKMLSSAHFKVLYYEEDSNKIFPSLPTPIKGGVVISMWDNKNATDPIYLFTKYELLNQILRKVRALNPEQRTIKDIVSSRGMYRYSNKFFESVPDAYDRVGKGTGNMITSKAFSAFPEAFRLEPLSSESILFYGRYENRRTERFIERKFVLDNPYIDTFNVLISKANGTGEFGEVLSQPIIANPREGALDSSLSIGTFSTRAEAENLEKYIKSKFGRCLLSVKKVTQDNPKSVWDQMPLQDFSPTSDIDWSKTISEIDQQLYRKYELNEEEIDFIESHVKEMV